MVLDGNGHLVSRMLKKLTVRNLAIVEEAEAEFVSGLNVITGETGSGKSVLIGALDLALGGKAEATSVRDGAREAEVEAEFDDVVIRRTVTAAGRSRAWVNDESVKNARLRLCALFGEVLKTGLGLLGIETPSHI